MNDSWTSEPTIFDVKTRWLTDCPVGLRAERGAIFDRLLDRELAAARVEGADRERAAVVAMIREGADVIEKCADEQATSAGKAHRAGNALSEDAFMRRSERLHTSVRSLRKTAAAIEAGKHREKENGNG